MIPNFHDVGRSVGEQIAASVANNPSAAKKAVDLIIGAIAVTEPLGIRLTIPLLLQNPIVKDLMEKEKIGESTLRLAATEARKQWDAAQAAEQETAIKAPSRNRRSRATPKVDKQDVGSATEAAYDKPQATNTPSEIGEKSDLFGKSPFVDDVPVDKL